MSTVRGAGLAVAIVAALGGCRQIIGYQDPIVIDAAVACSDGTKDFGETDVDCGGGTCAPCADGKRCTVGADCEDKVCKGGACTAPTCDDKAENGQETDVDCGGTKCPKCMAGQRCKTGMDCVSGTCTAGMVCAASCTDQVKDGNESDVDCGGMCPGCAIHKNCGKNTDCDSGVCGSGKCVDFLVWAQRFGPLGGMDRSSLVGLGVDETGNAVLAANFAGKASFGGPNVYDSGFSNGIAFGYYSPLGVHLWDDGFAPSNSSEDRSLDRFAATAAGQFVGAGTYFSTGLDFGNGVMLPDTQPAPDDAFVVQLSSSNVFEGASAYGSQSAFNDSDLQGIAWDSSVGGTILVGQGSSGTYDLGSTTVHNGDLFVVNLGLGWGHTFNDGGAADRFAGVVTDASGDVIVAGMHEGTINFGGGPTDSATAGGGFVVKLDPTGTYLWSKSFAAGPEGLAVDDAGNVVLCGKFFGTADFGTGPLTSAGTSIFIARFDPMGTATLAKAFAIAEASPSVTTLVATDTAGNILLGANAHPGSVDFGGGLLSSVMLVAKLSSSGSHLWSKGLGMAPLDQLAGIATYDAHQILIGGRFTGTLTLGSSMVSSVGTTDVFLAKLSLPE